jgi:hypothetical protein
MEAYQRLELIIKKNEKEKKKMKKENEILLF